MKNNKKKCLNLMVLIFLIIILVIPFVVIAQENNDSEIIWSEDFESYDANKFPNTWKGSGNAPGGDNYVTDDDSYRGEKSLRLQGQYGGCWEALAHRYANMSIKVGSSFVFEFAIKVGKHTIGCHNFSAGFSLRTGASWTNNGRWLIIFGKDMKTLYGGEKAIGIFEINKWYHVKIQYTWISNSTIEISYWINGEKKGSITDSPKPYETDLLWVSPNSGDGITWFDDIQVYEGEVFDLPVVEIIIITSTAVGISLAAIIGGTGLGKYKFLSFLSLLGPLYLRTVREEVFDNEKRLSMYNHIAENQPVVYSDIKKSLTLSHGEINWHANMMQQLGLIRVERKGFNVFFKIYGERLPPDKFVKLTDTQKNILDMIKNKPGVTQNEIVEKLNLKQQNISYNLRKLVEKGKIQVKKQGRIKDYHLIE